MEFTTLYKYFQVLIIVFFTSCREVRSFFNWQIDFRLSSLFASLSKLYEAIGAHFLLRLCPPTHLCTKTFRRAAATGGHTIGSRAAAAAASFSSLLLCFIEQKHSSSLLSYLLYMASNQERSKVSSPPPIRKEKRSHRLD